MLIKDEPVYEDFSPLGENFNLWPAGIWGVEVRGRGRALWFNTYIHICLVHLPTETGVWVQNPTHWIFQRLSLPVTVLGCIELGRNSFSCSVCRVFNQPGSFSVPCKLGSSFHFWPLLFPRVKPSEGLQSELAPLQSVFLPPPPHPTRA